MTLLNFLSCGIEVAEPDPPLKERAEGDVSSNRVNFYQLALVK